MYKFDYITDLLELKMMPIQPDTPSDNQLLSQSDAASLILSVGCIAYPSLADTASGKSTFASYRSRSLSPLF